MKKAVLSFGRLNPPTVGHEKLVTKVQELARRSNATPLVYLSHTQNVKKDPLSYADKITFARKAFGSLVIPTSARTIIEVLKELEQQGYTNVTLVAGSDRVPEFKAMIGRVQGKDFNFNSLDVVSAGERDPDAEGVSGMSASKLRALAASDDKEAFMKGIPSKLSAADGNKMYKALRKGMMVEDFDLESFVDNLDVDSVDLDEEDDIEEVLTLTQRLKKSRAMKRLAPRFKRLRAVKAKRMAPPERLQQRARKKAIALIRKRAAGDMGAHYSELSPAAKITVDRLIQKRLPLVGKLAQRLLPAVRKAEIERLKRVRTPQASDKKEEYMSEATAVRQDPDIAKRAGTQPAKYFKDLSVSTKKARDTHFKKGREKESDDPSAYTPAPGDKSAETKPSVHTKKFKQIYGQNYSGQTYDNGDDDIVLKKMRVSMISGEKQVKLNNAFEKMDEGDMADRVRARHKAEKERIKARHERELETARVQDVRTEETNLDEQFDKYSTSSIAPRDNYTLEQKSVEGLKKKAEKTGISYGILKKVYDRGVAAWRTGHRPGTTPQQWGFARVNSFATGGKTRTTADADLWAKVRKEDVRVGPYFKKAGITEQSIFSLNWKNEDPAEYAMHLSQFFGEPDFMTDEEVVWEAKDGFKRIVVKDEYILHGSPAPHYDFIYCYIDLFVPNKFATALAESSGSILIDFLKGEVGARCGSLTANATTLNYVLDVVAGRVAPSKEEYEKRILNMSSMFDRGEKFEVSWWPDDTEDADPSNPYYAEESVAHRLFCGHCLAEGQGLWHNIHKKRQEGRPMRSPGSKGAPTKQDFKNASEDVGTVAHHLGIGTTFKHMMKHAVTHVDVDVDGDVDNLEKMTPDEITGTERPNLTGKMFKKYKKEKQHTRQGVAFEDFKLNRLGSNPGKFKRLVTKHLGAKAAEKIGASDGNKIMAIAKKKGDQNLFRQGSFIKNFYGKTNEEVNEQSLDEAFTMAMETPAGMGSIITAADMGIKIQGAFALHPSITETGGAGEEGTDKLAKRYKKDTPGQNESICELSDDDEFYGFTEEEFEVTGEEQYEEGWDDEELLEAEYQGRKVTLGKPFLTPEGPKKRSVYVTNDKGNVVKVNFGDPNMRIKKSDPDRRRSFRARHNCDDPGPRWKARYWSCKAW